MKNIMTGAAALLGLMLAPVAHAQDAAWWVLCGGCQSEMEFRRAVLAVPGGDRVYFVSNPETGASLKFEKRATLKEVSGGVVQTTKVDDLPLAGEQAEGLAAMLASARILQPEINRADIVGEGFDRRADSVAGDLEGGVLSSSLLSWLRIVLLRQGLFPDAHQASETLGVNISRVVPGSDRHGVRWWPLRIGVDYPDGSALWISLSADAQTWSLLQLEDAGGRILPVRGPDSSGHAPVDAAGFAGLEFLFGSGPGVDALVEWLNTQSTSPMSCRTSPAKEDLIRVACRRADP